MKKILAKNWMAKIASLLLAIALWFLINVDLNKGKRPIDVQVEKPPLEAPRTNPGEL